jgi:photosystem II stability/assembly factor-like uncharacterized protein
MLGAVAGLCALLPGGTARADGAFPAPFRLFLPANLPDDTTVTTNFGLISTRDGGRTWAWTCEHGAADLGSLYQQAADGGSGRILGLAHNGLIFTDDDGCSWSTAAGFPTGELVDDSFIDPANPSHVVAIAHHGSGSSAVFELFVSTNGGTTFLGAPLFATEPGFRLDGVELARSNPNRIYATTSPWTATSNGTPPRILRSDDGGRSFTTLEASALTPGGTLGIAAVDPEDADRLYLRSSGVVDERLLISNDAGQTLTVALTADSGQQLSAFFRRADGTLFAAAFDSTSGTLFRSTDSGASFQPLPATLHIGSIAERGGALYVLANGLDDPFLVGISRDNGDTFQGLLDYASVGGVKTCAADLRNVCATSCLNLNGADVFAPLVCTTLVGALPPPGGSPDAAGGRITSSCGGCGIAASPAARAHAERQGRTHARGRAGAALEALLDGGVLASVLVAAALCVARTRGHRDSARRKDLGKPPDTHEK